MAFALTTGSGRGCLASFAGCWRRSAAVVVPNAALADMVEVSFFTVPSSFFSFSGCCNLLAALGLVAAWPERHCRGLKLLPMKILLLLLLLALARLLDLTYFFRFLLFAKCGWGLPPPWHRLACFLFAGAARVRLVVFCPSLCLHCRALPLVYRISSPSRCYL